MKTLLRLAEALEDESKCAKHRVAAVIADGTRIWSTGVNGTPAGHTNCNMLFNSTTVHREPERTQHREWALLHEIHAEINAINRMDDFVLEPTSQLICVVTRTPCDACAKRLLEIGVKHVAILTSTVSNVGIISPLFKDAQIPVTVWTPDYDGRFDLEFAVFNGERIPYPYNTDIEYNGKDFWEICNGKMAYVYYSDPALYEHEEM